MKLLGLAIALIVAIIGIVSPNQSANDIVFVLSGDTDGYLSPCGCTKPMTGGIRRRATAVRQLTKGHKAVILENGGLLGGLSKQDVLKAESLAESLRSIGVTAVNISESEVGLGGEFVSSLSRLSGGTLISSNSPNMDGVKQFVKSPPFLIGSLSILEDPKAMSNDTAVNLLTETAKKSKLKPVLMIQNGLDEAKRLANKFPTLCLIQYSSRGEANKAAIVVGSTLLVSTGDHAKEIVRLVYRNGAFSGYTVVNLGPQYADDPDVSRLYLRYLGRVDSYGLLADVVREPSNKFAGSASCTKCHTEAARVWKNSKHAGALATLEADGHGKDPECVSCHVVGLNFETGYYSRDKTPNLANVGCESCHGPSADHVKMPMSSPKPKLDKNVCMNCHNPGHDPGFNFVEKWARIAHR